jgi:hypothetical protein
MPKYIVPITFYGTITANNAQEALDKVYDGLSDACGAYEDAMMLLGMTDTEHLHEEPEEQ